MKKKRSTFVTSNWRRRLGARRWLMADEDGRPAAAADEQDGQVELRGDLPQPWNLGEDVLDDLGVGVEQTRGGEEAADPGGLEVGYDVYQHQARDPRPHRRIAEGGDGGEPAQRGADDHASRWLGVEHGGDVGCAGRERLLRAAAVTVNESARPDISARQRAGRRPEQFTAAAQPGS